MNMGFLQSSSWSSTKNQAPPYASSSSSAMSLCHDELPVSWSQLLLGGSLNDFQTRKLVDVDGWEDPTVAYDASAAAHGADDANRVASESRYMYGSTEEIQQQLAEAAAASWASWGQTNSNLPVSSPRSCVTTSLGSNMLDFSNGKPAEKRRLGAQPALLDHSSECNSKETGAASKKIKVVSCAAQSTFRVVRKEKLGDRITALHQLVSPFGKTDTASVLLEAIGYIRFLQNQVEALSSPYLGSGESDSARQPAVKGRSCVFPEDPGQVDGGEPKGLRSRGLCLVPLSCTLHVGGSNGADYWAASLAAGFR
ncbi:transcription factor bHLH68-like [Iris pallida]|uniref:Transcription factor bHLH68-like n=1 Tax=Iris pallida TaxID=29817 RepID=A0AAX6HXB9_IRIPA|nr:transcription factor bHLH68-like [Iris pallida]